MFACIILEKGKALSCLMRHVHETLFTIVLRIVYRRLTDTFVFLQHVVPDRFFLAAAVVVTVVGAKRKGRMRLLRVPRIMKT